MEFCLSTLSESQSGAIRGLSLHWGLESEGRASRKQMNGEALRWETGGDLAHAGDRSAGGVGAVVKEREGG